VTNGGAMSAGTEIAPESIVLDYGVKLVRKSDSWLMRAIGFVLRPIVPAFMTRFWTTIGETNYTPTVYDDNSDWGTPTWQARHADVIDHERVHIMQKRRFTMPLFVLMYLGPSAFLAPATLILAIMSVWLPTGIASLVGLVASVVLAPLSIGLAWGRWRIEREAYLVNIRTSRNQSITIRWVANTLHENYLMTWPRKWAIRWLTKNT